MEDRITPRAGALDPTFGMDGKVVTDFPSFDVAGQDFSSGAAIQQADGKIVVAGNTSQPGGVAGLGLARYHSDGSLDISFDSDGRVRQHFAGVSNLDIRGMALQADGKIVVAGRATLGGPDFFVARFTTDGALDASFGSGGWLTTDFGGTSDFANSVAVQADGKIVVAGYSNQGGTTGNDFALARYGSNGALDTGFDGDGKVTTSFANLTANIDGQTDDFARSVAVHSDGKIVVAGLSDQGRSNGYDFALARYGSNGALDTSFDSDGMVATSFGSAIDGAQSVTVQADGKIVAAGYSDLGGSTGHDFALARYTIDGALDTTFDGDGKVTTNFGSSEDFAQSVTVQADGKVVVAGYSNQGGSTGWDFALARYGSNGTPDTGFGSDGKVTTNLDSINDYAVSVAVQADGNFVVAGPSNQVGSTGWDFALARYLGSDNLAPTADAGGPYTVSEGGSVTGPPHERWTPS